MLGEVALRTWAIDAVLPNHEDVYVVYVLFADRPVVGPRRREDGDIGSFRQQVAKWFMHAFAAPPCVLRRRGRRHPLMIAFIPGSPSWQTVWIRKPPSDAHASRLACCLDPLEAFLLQYIGQFFTDVQEHWQAGRQNDDWKTVSAETWTES